ncbi:MAG: BatA domain-containing protein [Polaribacter sp.]
MQFKHPEILYFLALVIIPILVHLFQLQKFVKVPFTNVAFLQQLIQQTRKSSRLKKWLILATRIILFSAILFSFSKPYFSSKDIDKKQQTFIYLDNSLSTNTEGKKGDLLKNATQEIIENTSENDTYSLLTNSKFLNNITKTALKKELLNIKNTPKKFNLETVLLKIKSNQKFETNTLYKNILLSDFQYTYKSKFTNVTPPISLLNLEPSKKNNISIDSVFTEHKNTSKFIVHILLKNQGEEKKNVPIALYNDEKLVSKQSFSIDKNSTQTIQFTIENTSVFLGKLEFTFSDTFPFDNTFYFTLNSTKKINVLAIGKATNFLSKIYTKKEFNFTNTTLQNTNYNSIQKQQLIIINELEKIPQTLLTSLVNFSKNGGNLVIIPTQKINLNSYNTLFNNLNIGKINSVKKDTLKITHINYRHPLLANVFSKKVQNFQYPTTQSHYPTSFKNTSTIIGYENNEGFIQEVTLQNSKLYWVASSLQNKNSNFTNSPLIVPVFYNFGTTSLQHSKLYYQLDKTNKIDVNIQLAKDEILSIKNNENSFIPLQQTFQNKVSVTTKEQPLVAGFYEIVAQEKAIQQIAFNNPKEESVLNYMDLEELSKDNKNLIISSSIKDTFEKLNKKNEVHWLWKWFLALAIVSLLLEILILKFLKP